MSSCCCSCSVWLCTHCHCHLLKGLQHCVNFYVIANVQAREWWLDAKSGRCLQNSKCEHKGTIRGCNNHSKANVRKHRCLFEFFLTEQLCTSTAHWKLRFCSILSSKYFALSMYIARWLSKSLIVIVKLYPYMRFQKHLLRSKL